MSTETIWLDVPPGVNVDWLRKVPVYRKGGPRDGDRMGTAYRTPDGGWEFKLDPEHGMVVRPRKDAS
jgi:hypothetical protein